nr:hypothetical protein [Rugamonas sp.]
MHHLLHGAGVVLQDGGVARIGPRIIGAAQLADRQAVQIVQRLQADAGAGDDADVEAGHRRHVARVGQQVRIVEAYHQVGAADFQHELAAHLGRHRVGDGDAALARQCAHHLDKNPAGPALLLHAEQGRHQRHRAQSR